MSTTYKIFFVFIVFIILFLIQSLLNLFEPFNNNDKKQPFYYKTSSDRGFFNL